MKNLDNKINLCVVGLGYVGLPLAVEFSKKYVVTGYDTSKTRIAELFNHIDKTQEVDTNILVKSNIAFANDSSCLNDQDVYIVTVPTPVDNDNLPNLQPLEMATHLIAQHISEGAIVIYESTVYPGVTDNICVPILERISNLKLNEDFHVGYSPERINPGDKQRPLTQITKLTSGSDEISADFIDKLYQSIIDAPTYKCSSIKIAEAAKVMENTQRDVNIALMNELSNISHALRIDTNEIIDAANTKWNFIPFRPGLVGGHCIGVDPYYLQYAAQQSNILSRIISAARIVNNEVPFKIIKQLKEHILERDLRKSDTRILFLGETFKENCPDTRNSKVEMIVKALKEQNFNVSVHDPYTSTTSFELFLAKNESCFDVVVLAVGHDTYISAGVRTIRCLCSENGLFYDLKGYFSIDDSDYRL